MVYTVSHSWFSSESLTFAELYMAQDQQKWVRIPILCKLVCFLWAHWLLKDSLIHLPQRKVAWYTCIALYKTSPWIQGSHSVSRKGSQMNVLILLSQNAASCHQKQDLQGFRCSIIAFDGNRCCWGNKWKVGEGGREEGGGEKRIGNLSCRSLSVFYSQGDCFDPCQWV